LVEFFKSLIDRGIAKTLLLIRDERLFDICHNVKTSGIIHLDELSIDIPNKVHGYRYEAVNVSAFMEALDYVDLHYPDYCFIDLGCGKSFAMMLASQYGFKRVIGVEFSAALVERCRSNLSTFYANPKLKYRPAYEILNLDVTRFELPAGNNVLFLFNPFNKSVLRETFRNFLAVIDSSVFETYVIYINALHREVLSDLGFNLLHYYPTDPLNVYKNGTAIFRL